MTNMVSASWLLWLSARMTQDGTEELAKTAIRATLKYSKIEEEDRAAILADLSSPDGGLTQSVANLIYQLRPLLMPVGIKFKISRITVALAAKYARGAAELDVPLSTLKALHQTLSRLVEFYGEKGKNYATSLNGDLEQTDPVPHLLTEWVPPDDADPVAFRWPRDLEKAKAGMLERDADWQAVTVPDPAQCRTMRLLVLSVWMRRKELAALQATPEKYPYPVMPVIVLRHMEAWQTDTPEMSTEGMIMRSPTGQRDGTFPGLLPEVAERLVDNPATSTTTGWPVGFWWSELTHPYWAFHEVGYEVEVFSLAGGKCEADGMSDPRDPSGYSASDLISMGFIHTPSLAALVEQTKPVSDLAVDAFDAIVVAGGQAPMFSFAQATALQEKFVAFYEAGKIAAALCHGVALLRYARLSSGELLAKGRTVTGFSDAEEDFADSAVRSMGALSADGHLMPWRIEAELKKIGANFVQGGLWRGFAVRDGNLITGQQNFSGAETARLIIEAIGR